MDINLLEDKEEDRIVYDTNQIDDIIEAFYINKFLD